jgi:glycogen phosphorylase
VRFFAEATADLELRTDLVSDDFISYLTAQKMVDEAYVDRPAWIEKTSESTSSLAALPPSSSLIRIASPVNTTARMGKFSSDRAVSQYAEEIWSVEPHKIPPVA